MKVGVKDVSGKIKVVIVAPSLNYVGGQAVQAELLSRLWRSDPEADVSFLAVDPPLPKLITWAKGIPGLRTVLREPIYLFHLWRALKDIDVAHVFAASYWSFLLAPVPAWFFAKLQNKKCIINYRSGEARDHLLRFRSGKFVLSQADKIVAPSNYLADVFAEFGLRTSVIPNLVDLEQFRFRERVPLHPRLLCTRGFSQYYRVDIVVRAFSEVQKQYPNAQLRLVGSGPLESAIRRQAAQLGLTGITFVGLASRQDIGRHYDESDIFINASDLDNMPVSVIEAFRAGTPVVTTSPEAIPYLVEHERTGLLSGVGDASALASNVLRLLREPGLAERLAQQAYRESCKFTWQEVRPQWLKLYRELALCAELRDSATPRKQESPAG